MTEEAHSFFCDTAMYTVHSHLGRLMTFILHVNIFQTGLGLVDPSNLSLVPATGAETDLMGRVKLYEG